MEGKAKAKTLKEHVYQEVRKAIINGAPFSGTTFTEADLCERYKVSKPPVREALIELSKDNFIKSIPRHGYIVTPCSVQEALDILDVRLDIELGQWDRTRQILTDKKIEEFKRSIPKELKAKASINYALLYDRTMKFHLCLCRLGENESATKTLESIFRSYSRFFRFYYENAVSDGTERKGQEAYIGYHGRIVAAMDAHDYEKVGLLLKEDILNVRNTVKTLLVLQN